MRQILQVRQNHGQSSSFDHLVDLASKVMQCADAVVELDQSIDPNVGRTSAVPQNSSLLAFARECEVVTVISDVRSDSRFPNYSLLGDDSEIGYFACAPLVDSAGQRIGTLHVSDRQARDRQRSNEIDAMEALATAIVREIELDRSRRALHRQDLELERLTEVQALKDEFVATVSHELRTPLTSISASLALLEEGIMGQLSDDARAIVGVATSNTVRLIALVDDLLDLERTTFRAEHHELVSAKIAPLVQEACTVVEGMARSRGIDLVLEDRLAHEVFLDCEPDRIVQLFLNLLDNAIKFSDVGTQVVIRVEQPSTTEVAVSVMDTGLGIAEENRSRLFDAFWQADSSASRTAGGSGLGLAIARRIVERHRGQVEVSSEPGVGSTFRVILPIDSTMTQEASVNGS